MFAILKTGGKQYKVSQDSVIKVEKVTAKTGEKIKIEDVMFLDDGSKQSVGTPFLNGVSVEAEVLEQKKDKKVLIFKKKRRHNYRRKKGHRQEVSLLKVTKINNK